MRGQDVAQGGGVPGVEGVDALAVHAGEATALGDLALLARGGGGEQALAHVEQEVDQVRVAVEEGAKDERVAVGGIDARQLGVDADDIVRGPDAALVAHDVAQCGEVGPGVGLARAVARDRLAFGGVEARAAAQAVTRFVHRTQAVAVVHAVARRLVLAVEKGGRDAGGDKVEGKGVAGSLGVEKGGVEAPVARQARAQLLPVAVGEGRVKAVALAREVDDGIAEPVAAEDEDLGHAVGVPVERHAELDPVGLAGRLDLTDEGAPGVLLEDQAVVAQRGVRHAHQEAKAGDGARAALAAAAQGLDPADEVAELGEVVLVLVPGEEEKELDLADGGGVEAREEGEQVGGGEALVQPGALAGADPLDAERVLLLARRQLGVEEQAHVLQDVGALAEDRDPLVEAMQLEEEGQDLAVGVEIETVEADLGHALGALEAARRGEQVGQGQLAVGLAVIAFKAKGAKGGAAIVDLEVGGVGLGGVEQGHVDRQVVGGGRADGFARLVEGAGDPQPVDGCRGAGQCGATGVAALSARRNFIARWGLRRQRTPVAQRAAPC